MIALVEGKFETPIVQSHELQHTQVENKDFNFESQFISHLVEKSKTKSKAKLRYQCLSFQLHVEQFLQFAFCFIMLIIFGLYS